MSALSSGDAQLDATERARFRADARELFALACRYAGESRPPLLLVVCGLSGTGKSTIAEQLARTGSARVLSTDRIRKELHGAAPTERRAAAFQAGIYSPGATRRTYATLADRAEGLLRAGHPVIADGTFSQAWQRDLMLAAADRAGALGLLLELRASPQQARQRLDLRQGAATTESDADWAIHRAQRTRWEPITLPAWDHPVVSTDGDVADVVRAASQELRARLEP